MNRSAADHDLKVMAVHSQASVHDASAETGLGSQTEHLLQVFEAGREQLAELYLEHAIARSDAPVNEFSAVVAETRKQEKQS